MTQQFGMARMLRLCVVGDLDGVHTRAWLRWFVERGHEVHAISYYPPSTRVEGVKVHVLNPHRGAGQVANAESREKAERMLPSAVRLANAFRYSRRGLSRLVWQIAPDVLHAHYVVEHGFYASFVDYHPYVVSAWGSDLLVTADATPLSRWIARFAMRRADLVTSNNEYMASRALALGARQGRVEVVTLGAERFFLERPGASVNLRNDDRLAPSILSTRSLDSPLYNVDTIIRAMAIVHEKMPQARLTVAGEGRLRPQLESLTSDLGLTECVYFAGWLDREALRDAMLRAHVFVSVPSSDATSVALLQAMACGCWPIVSDIATQRELVDDGRNGYRVPVRDSEALAGRILDSLGEAARRRETVETNRRFVAEKGLLETNMAKMEDLYYRLAMASSGGAG